MPFPVVDRILRQTTYGIFHRICSRVVHFTFCFGVGLDKDRAFYPAVLIVIALLYGLFAMIGGSLKALGYEALPMLVFITLATVGFKRNAWLVVIGLAAHGVFDFFHARIIPNPGVPPCWPGFCLAYDVVAAIYLAVLLRRTRRAVG